ncbi:unnamed protein product, partial [Symbiodinium sp. KB8]
LGPLPLRQIGSKSGNSGNQCRKKLAAKQVPAQDLNTRGDAHKEALLAAAQPTIRESLRGLRPRGQNKTSTPTWPLCGTAGLQNPLIRACSVLEFDRAKISCQAQLSNAVLAARGEVLQSKNSIKAMAGVLPEVKLPGTALALGSSSSVAAKSSESQSLPSTSLALPSQTPRQRLRGGLTTALPAVTGDFPAPSMANQM